MRCHHLPWIAIATEMLHVNQYLHAHVGHWLHDQTIVSISQQTSTLPLHHIPTVVFFPGATIHKFDVLLNGICNVTACHLFMVINISNYSKAIIEQVVEGPRVQASCENL